MRELVGNVLLLQVGKTSSVTNVILAALIKKSLNYDCIEEVYGCVGGIKSLLNEQFVDLAGQQQKNISNLVGTPGAALKSFEDDDYDSDKVIQVLKKNNIVYLFVIGDFFAVKQCKKIESAAKAANYEVSVMLIPSCSNNNMQLTDHCLGFGSMAKHLAISTKAIVANVQSSQANGAITILELKGCESEWVISAAALARGRKDSSDAPHMIILSKFDEGTFVKNINQTIRNFGNCVIVVGDKLTDMRGNDISASGSAAEHIKMIAGANFDVPVDIVTFRDWNLTSCMTLSGADVLECELCAQKALELAVTVGISGKMITLLRADGIKYSSEVNCVDFENISEKEKEFPESWYVYEEMNLDVPFFKYAVPLIAGEVTCAYENGIQSFSKLK